MAVTRAAARAAQTARRTKQSATAVVGTALNATRKSISTGASRNNPNSRLLALPPELRNVVWEYVVGSGDGASPDLNRLRVPTLAHTCQQLRNEVLRTIGAALRHKQWRARFPTIRFDPGHPFRVTPPPQSPRTFLQRSSANRAWINTMLPRPFYRKDIANLSSLDFDFAKTKTISIRQETRRYRRYGDGPRPDGTWRYACQRGPTIAVVVEEAGVRLHAPGDFPSRWRVENRRFRNAMRMAKQVQGRAGFDGFTVTDVGSVISAYHSSSCARELRGLGLEA